MSRPEFDSEALFSGHFKDVGVGKTTTYVNLSREKA